MTRPSAFSGLPEAFVEAVRGLFQLLDVEGKGWIELTGEEPLAILFMPNEIQPGNNC